MATTGEELGSAFAKAYEPVFAFVEGCDDATWRSIDAGEGATVAAVLNHVAQSMRYNGSVLKAVREGTAPVQLTQEGIDEFNQKEKAEADAGTPSREEVLAALRSGVERNVASMSSLPDEAFTKPIPIAVGDHAASTLQQWIEEIALPHGPSHVAGLNRG